MDFKKIYLVITISALSAFGPIVTDMYLPSLPSLADSFKCSAAFVQMSMSVCMFGLALGQIFIGPLSDKFGRRGLLLISMWVFALSTFACIFPINIYFFIAMRFLQGIAGAGGIVLSRAISSDKFSGKELIKFLSLIAAVNGIAPVVAPLAGGLVLTFFYWRMIFAMLFLLGLAILFLSCFMSESLPKERRLGDDRLAIFRAYKNVLCDKISFPYILQQGFVALILFTYIVSSPFIFVKIYGVSELVFSAFFATNAVGIALGASLSGRIKKASFAVLLGSSLALVAAFCATACAFGGAHIALFEASLFALLASCGLTFPSASAIILDSQRKNAGTAAALLGASSFFAGAIASQITGFFEVSKIFCALIICGGLCALAMSIFAGRNFSKRGQIE